MAGIAICGCFVVCCCCIAPAILGSVYLLANYTPTVFLYTVLNVIGYSLLVIALIYLLAYVFYKIHKTGLQMVELKHRNKYLYKSEDLKSNYREMLKVIVSNLGLIAMFYYLGGYFQRTYLNILIIFYISFIFGYVAVYPLTEEQTIALIETNMRWRVENKIRQMAAINTFIFFAMFGSIYYFYY
jgi:hypothetical protein